jgi:hypothetical protein
MPIPVTALSKAWVCSRSLAGNVESNPPGGNGGLCLVGAVCSKVEVSASG